MVSATAAPSSGNWLTIAMKRSSYVTSTQSRTGLNSLGIPILCNDLLRNTQFCMAPHKKLCTDTGQSDTNRDQKNRNGDDAKPRRENIQIGKNRGSNNNPVKP